MMGFRIARYFFLIVLGKSTSTLHLSHGIMQSVEEDQALLQSRQCAPYMETVHFNMGRLLEYNDEDLINLACRPSETDHQDRIETLETMIVQAKQHKNNTNECQACDKRLVLQDQTLLLRALTSPSWCKELVESEIDLLYESSSLQKKQQGPGHSRYEQQVRFAGKAGNLPVLRFVANCCQAYQQSSSSSSSLQQRPQTIMEQQPTREKNQPVYTKEEELGGQAMGFVANSCQSSLSSSMQ